MIWFGCPCDSRGTRPFALVCFLLRTTILLHARGGYSSATIVEGSSTPFAASAPLSRSSINVNQDAAVPIPTEENLLVDFSFRRIGPGGLPDLPDYLAQTQTQGNPLTARPHSESPTAESPHANSDAFVDEAATATVMQGAQATQDLRSILRQGSHDAAPPLALSLRECSLGDAGVAKVARSAWVGGTMGVAALSLRHNQVRA